LAIIALAFLLTGLGEGSIENSDDGITSSVLRGMARGEHLGDLTFQGAVEHQRPLLFYWLGAAVVKMLGPSELGLRLLPALCTAIAALLAFGIARRLGASPLVALTSGLLYLALWLPVRVSRRVGEDAMLTALLAGALLCYLGARERPRRFLAWGLLFGLAVMTKSTVAILAPLTVGAHLLVVDRRMLRTRWPYLGLLVGIVVAAPWHLVQTARYGRAFWSDYLGHGVTRVFARTLPGQTDAWIYARDLFSHDPVLAPICLLGLALLGSSVVLARRQRARSSPALAVLLAAFFPALLFSISRTRLSHYMLPAYAPLAAMAGCGLGAFLRRPLLQALLALILLSLAPILRAGDLLGADYAPSMKALALEAKKRLGPSDALYTFDVYHTAAAFYSDRKTVLVTESPSALEKLLSSRLLARSPDTVRLGSTGELAALASSAARSCVILPSERLPDLLRAFGARGRELSEVDRPELGMLCLGAPP
jgi:4-amino-4-deoxy-L-arabinose transferase-like glycosyltransferase